MDAQTSAIIKAYRGFNARDIDTVLSLMQPDVHWPNGWEGGYVQGQEAVREYWTRQWQEIDPTVNPAHITPMEDGRVNVTVHQIIKDMQGNIQFDGKLHHIYTFTNGLISKMEIEE